MTDNVDCATADNSNYTPAWVTVALESVGGTVSSKEEKPPKYPIRDFGFTCYNCKQQGASWMVKILRGAYNDTFLSHSSIKQRAFPIRCKRCKSMSRKWTNAKKKFVEMDILRYDRGIEHLRFVTLTHEMWSYRVSPESVLEQREQLKRRAIKKFNNWRQRNEWWISKEPVGQIWPECVVTPVWEGYGFDEVKLHFHLHMILVSEYLDNKPVYGINSEGEPYLGDSRFHKEWGGIVDVRAVKDYQVPYNHNGKTRKGCGRKACMRYLVKYITKSDTWRSIPIKGGKMNEIL